MDTKAIFDILGIRARTQCYTHLLDYAFQSSEAFQTEVLLQLKEKNFSDWQSKTHFTIDIRMDNMLAKAKLDWVLYNRQCQRIYVLENKFQNRPRPEQLNIFSSREFRQKLIRALGMDQASLRFVFISLYENSSREEWFRSISYQQLMDCYPNKWKDPNLSLLMSELQEWVKQPMSGPAPRDMEEEQMEPLNRNGFAEPIFLNRSKPKTNSEVLSDTASHSGQRSVQTAQWYQETWKEVIQTTDYSQHRRRHLL